MTRREALVILLEAAGRDNTGAGCGFRSNSEDQRDRVSQAAARLWMEAFGFPPDENALRNYGFRMVEK